MGGAGQAGVVGADRHLDVVEQALGDLVAIEVLPGHLAHRAVHRLVVVGGGDDEVGHGDEVVVAHLVVVEEGAARGLDHAHTLAPALAARHELGAGEVVVVQQVLDGLGGEEHLDHACPVEGQAAMQRLAAGVGDELAALVLGKRRGDAVAVLHARERADLVPAGLGAHGREVGELHVAPGLDLLGDQAVVGLVIDLVEEDLAVGVPGAQHAVVEVEAAVGRDHAHEARAEGAEVVVERGVLLVQLLDDAHRVAAPGDHLVGVLEQVLALVDGQRTIDATRHRARAVHALAGSQADDLLAVLAQQDAFLGDVGVFLRHADDVAPTDLGVEAEQQVGRGQVEEVQRVRLQDLAVVHQAAHLVGGRGDLGGADDEVERLARREVVRDRADAAQALHHHRHFPVRTALDEALEAAEFDDVQAHLVHLVVLVEQDGDLAVALHARHGVDGDAAQGTGVGGGGFEFEVHLDVVVSERLAACAAPTGRPRGSGLGSRLAPLLQSARAPRFSVGAAQAASLSGFQS